MEQFDEARTPMSASEISRTIDAPLSSVIDLLKCLVELGYIAYDQRSRKYFMTPRVAMLGNWLDHSQVYEKSFRTIISELQEKTNETVSVFCQDRFQMRCIATKKGNHPLSFGTLVGETYPVIGSAVGAALLAHWTDDEIQKFLKKADPQNEMLVDAETAMKIIKKARKNGFSSMYDTVIPEVGAVTIAARSAGNQWLVYSIGGSSKRIKQDEGNIVRLLKDVVLNKD